MSIATNLSGWFVGMFPEWDVPEFIAQLDGQVNAVFAGLSGLGAWVDFNITFTVVGLALLAYLTGLTIKAARAVASYIPFVGGAG